jgi:hypothetical protein
MVRETYTFHVEHRKNVYVNVLMSLLDIAKRFKSPVWLATVLEQGDVLQTGIDANYAYVVGVTTEKGDGNWCRERFSGIPSVSIFYGPDMVLFEVIAGILQPVTFCLDSRSEPAPALIQELGVLKHHRIKTHTIIIRNVSLFGTEASGRIEWPQVREVLRRINDRYRFTELLEDDAVVATFP